MVLPEAISGETILGSYAQNQEVIYSLSEMFYGFIPGSVGETSKVLIIIRCFNFDLYQRLVVGE